MNIPKYVQEMMRRAKFALGYGDPGYTIEIEKATQYTKVSSLKNEVLRLEKWVERNMPVDDLDVKTIVINTIPKKTHYDRQYAVVTIYDPIMQHLEKYIEK